jgi:hypothetical protein
VLADNVLKVNSTPSTFASKIMAILYEENPNQNKEGKKKNNQINICEEQGKLHPVFLPLPAITAIPVIGRT